LRHLRIGTRGSLLAKWQAESVRKQLFAGAGVEAEIVIIKTSGDKQQLSPLTQIGGKGIFIKELEEALLEESIDLAVHSVKDVPTDTPSRLMFPAVCRRDDVRDCLVGANSATLGTLRHGARVGTGSLRRTNSPTSSPTATGSASTAGAHTGGTPVGSAASSGKEDGTPGRASKGDPVAAPTVNPAPTAQLSAPTAALGR